ncbi:MAG: FIST C-terminal domain-containing protein [Acidimicrobiia bacterium]|nr:FIST C-terminal domain-containing protein [Acidimicrobiia bacterium]
MSASDRTYAAGLSRHPDAAAAVGEVVGAIGDRLSGSPSVSVLFVSGSHIDSLPEIVDTIHTVLAPDTLIGTTAVGVVGGAEEVESGDAVALWAATGVPAASLRLEALPGSPPLLAGLPDRVEAGATVLVLADPYSYPIDALVDHVNDQPEQVGLVGGLASASPERNRVVLDDEIHLDGAVGLLLGPDSARPIVSQGCRPIGSPWVVTGADGQLVRTLGGQSAMDRLTAVIEGLSDHDRRIAARGLHVGLVADEQQAEFDQGDFLIRGVLGAERSSGSVAVGDEVRIGQILQFQIRDSASASAELDRLLDGAAGRSALVFTCNGRGSHLFDELHHDASRVHGVVGDAVSGMFCAGELGPIADHNAVHGFTATVLLFD